MNHLQPVTRASGGPLLTRMASLQGYDFPWYISFGASKDKVAVLLPGLSLMSSFISRDVRNSEFLQAVPCPS